MDDGAATPIFSDAAKQVVIRIISYTRDRNPSLNQFSYPQAKCLLYTSGANQRFRSANMD
ncbi:hypothetical protein ECDEC8A_3239 [Escherichia coli DEC8A]|nr:hypothetical protein ECDEC8A_3239 [Escherichia coli DEC8A]